MTTILSAPSPRQPLFSKCRRTHSSPLWNFSRFSLAPPKTNQQRRLTSLCSLPSSTSMIDGQQPSPSSTTELSPPQSDASETEEPTAVLPLSGCNTCGREERERGCNGEGRIQGGIATFPGFGWWPIKAYRPCPGFLASGGRYKRQGQSMDDVISGGGKGANAIGTFDRPMSRKKGKNRNQFKQ
ncbi:hypothetical protein Dimus_030620 [Dionaea muscipula]